MIHADGSSGIAVIIVDAAMKMTCVRSHVGALFAGMSRSCARTANLAISIADAGNARRCCTGATIREKCDQLSVCYFSV